MSGIANLTAISIVVAAVVGALLWWGIDEWLMARK